MLLDELINLFKEDLDRRVDADQIKPATRRSNLENIEAWRKALPPEVVLVSDLKRNHLEFEKSWHRVINVKRLMNWSLERKLIADNPFAGVKAKAPPSRTRTVSRAEMARFLRHANRGVRWYYVFLWRMGCRPGEARELKWKNYVTAQGQVDGEAIEVHLFRLEEFKSRERRRDGHKREIFVDSYLARILARWQARRRPAGDDFLFLGRHGLPFTRNAIRCECRRTCKRAGLDRGCENIVTYSLRHSFFSRGILNGVDSRLLSIMGGHSPMSRQIDRYFHPDSVRLGQTIERVNGHVRRPKAKTKGDSNEHVRRRKSRRKEANNGSL